ncbi:hypothetical protein [Actinokineospora sp. NPDC004072]
MDAPIGLETSSTTPSARTENTRPSRCPTRNLQLTTGEGTNDNRQLSHLPTTIRNHLQRVRTVDIQKYHVDHDPDVQSMRPRRRSAHPNEVIPTDLAPLCVNGGSGQDALQFIAHT